MSRFVILNTLEWEACRALHAGEISEEEAMEELAGCAWLFRAAAGIDDAESAARAAVREFYATDEGRRVIEREGYTFLTWEEAIGWIPPEVWKRHGLELLGHPEVERVIVDSDEDLADGMEANLEMPLAR